MLTCIKCGAGIDEITVDAQIIVGFRLNEAGHVVGTKNSLTENDLIIKAQEEGPDYKNAFCGNCGTYMGMDYREDGTIVSFNNNPPEWK